MNTRLSTRNRLIGRHAHLAVAGKNSETGRLLAGMKDELSGLVQQSIPFREKIEKSGFERLSPRQLELLKLLVQGCSDDEVAAEMGIRRTSVNLCKRRLFLKLRVRGGDEAMAKYREHILAPCRWQDGIKTTARIDLFPAAKIDDGIRPDAVLAAERNEMGPDFEGFIQRFGAVITGWANSKKGLSQWVQLLRTARLSEQTIFSIVNADFQKRWPQYRRELEKRLTGRLMKDNSTGLDGAGRDAKPAEKLRQFFGSDAFKQWIRGNVLKTVNLAPSASSVSAFEAHCHLQAAFREQLHGVQLGMRKLMMFKHIMQTFADDE